MAGYIKLHRKFLKWGWYDDPITKIVFLHLLLNANWEDSEYHGEIIKPGQVVFGRKKYAEALGLSERKVRTAMDHLHNSGEISTSKTTNRFSVITIENWAKYQGAECESDQQNDREATNNRPTSDQQPTTSKNIRNKEVKNKSNRAFKPPTLEEVKEYCRERKNNVNPEAFIDFYESKGWMVGKNKMKNWQSAVRNWERRDAGRPQTTSKAPVEPPKYRDFKPEPKRETVEMPDEIRKKLREIF